MKLKLLIAVIGLQVAWILGTAAVQEQKLAQGALILLETRPVDPRDLLRGDYVILNYKISEASWQAFSPPLTQHLAPGSTVYVVLEPRGKFYEVARASLRPPEPAGAQVVLRGRVTSRTSIAAEFLEYGLERYYVAEGTGNPRGTLTVQAAVPRSGKAVIKQVFINGKPYAEAMQEKPATNR